ncbi:hypothetical protein D3C86_1972180 [compost metagenome]
MLVKLADPIENLNIGACSHRADQQEMFAHTLLVVAKRKKYREFPNGPKIGELLNIRFKKWPFICPIQHIL